MAIKSKSGNLICVVSDALAHILITKYNIPSINNQEEVEKILDKKIDWVGSRPDGKYLDYNGWFYIDILGKRKMKIALGKIKK